MPAGRKRYVGQFAWVSVGRIVAAVLQAILLVLVAQRTSPAEFGLLAATLGLATVVQTIFDLGVGTFISRERAASPESGAIATALRFTRVTSVTLAAFVLIGLTTAGALLDPVYFFLLPIAFSVAGERNADAQLAVVFADGDARINVSNLLARRLSAIVILILLGLVGTDPLLAFAIGVAVAALGSSVFANLYVARRVVTAPSIGYRELIRQSWPYWLNSVATQARNLDGTITAIVSGAVQAGYYSAGSRLTSPLRILPTSLASVLLPAASRAVSSALSLWPLVRLAGVMLVFVTLLYGVLFASAPWGIPFVLGEQYAGAVPAVQIVVVGLPLAAAASLTSSLLQGYGQKHFVATVAAATTAVCLALIAILAPVWGSIGAAAALSSSFAIQAALLVVRLFTVMRRPVDPPMSTS